MAPAYAALASPLAEGAGASADADASSSRTWRGAARAAALVFALASIAAAVVTVGVPAARQLQAGSVDDAVQEFGFDIMKEVGAKEVGFDIMKEVGVNLYKAFGGFDPFEFKCPPPGLKRFEGVLSTVQECCGFYDRIRWPYLFPECRGLYSNCSTCMKSSSPEEFDKHPVIGLAGLAWAANAAVYTLADKPVSTRLKGFFQAKLLRQGVTHGLISAGQMRGKVRDGLLATVPDLCPAIQDWTAYMLHEEDENLQARLYKSTSARLAVLVFRGTQGASVSNWEVDADLRTALLELGEGGNSTLVHKGFLRAINRVLPRIRKWVEGYFFHVFDAIPRDWTLVFTGHSLGGALAQLAATLAELQGWSRRPNATIVFGSPRLADSQLDHWWRERGLCKKLLRVNVYNDVVHWMPFLTTWKWTEMLRDFTGCVEDLEACRHRGLLAPAVELSDRWTHVCAESEVLVPGSARGVNVHLDDLSPVGGVLSHLNSQCLYGYGFGVLHSGVLERDGHCGGGHQPVCAA